MTVLKWFKQMLTGGATWSKIFAELIMYIFLSFIWASLTSWYHKTHIIDSFLNFWTFRVPLWIIASATIFFILIQMLRRWWKSRKIEEFIYDVDKKEIDREIYKQLSDKIGGDLMDWFRHFEIESKPFSIETINRINDTIIENQKPHTEFLNPNLEKIKKSLLKSMANFLTLVELQSTGVEGSELLNIKRNKMYTDTEKYEDYLDEVITAQKQIVFDYGSLVRSCRETLSV